MSTEKTTTNYLPETTKQPLETNLAKDLYNEFDPYLSIDTQPDLEKINLVLTKLSSLKADIESKVTTEIDLLIAQKLYYQYIEIINTILYITLFT